MPLKGKFLLVRYDSGIINILILGGSNKPQMYGNYEGFPFQYCIVWVDNIMTPVILYLRFLED